MRHEALQHRRSSRLDIDVVRKLHKTRRFERHEISVHLAMHCVRRREKKENIQNSLSKNGLALPTLFVDG